MRRGTSRCTPRRTCSGGGRTCRGRSATRRAGATTGGSACGGWITSSATPTGTGSGGLGWTASGSPCTPTGKKASRTPWSSRWRRRPLGPWSGTTPAGSRIRAIGYRGMVTQKRRHMHMHSLRTLHTIGLLNSLTVFMVFRMKLLGFLITATRRFTKRRILRIRGFCLMMQTVRFHLNLFLATISILVNNRYIFMLSLQKKFLLTSWISMRASQHMTTKMMPTIWTVQGTHTRYSPMSMSLMINLNLIGLLGLRIWDTIRPALKGCLLNMIIIYNHLVKAGVCQAYFCLRSILKKHKFTSSLMAMRISELASNQNVPCEYCHLITKSVYATMCMLSKIYCSCKYVSGYNALYSYVFCD